MKVKLKSYSTLQSYELDYPQNVELMLSIKQALEFAKRQISVIRKTDKFLAFKIVTMRNELKYKLPCY